MFAFRKLFISFLASFDMQTFLPYADVIESLRVLDSRRLGKQRVEAHQILNILLGRTDTKGWRTHPAVKMWKGYTNALKKYFNESLIEWTSRGYKNNMKFEKIRGKIVFPVWFGDEGFHSAHRGNLLRKNKKFYSQFGWKVSPNLSYFWSKR